MRIASLHICRKLVLPFGIVCLLAACSGGSEPTSAIESDALRRSSESRLERKEAVAGSVDVAAGVAENSGQTVSVSQNSQALAYPDPNVGINIDAGLGVEGARPIGLAEEEAGQIAETTTAQPVVDGIGTDTPSELPRPAGIPQTETFEETWKQTDVVPPLRKREPQAETKVAFIPRFSDPTEVPESYGGLTAADRACRADLQKLGVRFQDIPPISDGPNCGIAHPILVSGFSGGVRLMPAAKMNCNVTRMFAKWVKNELVPAARFRYFSGIKEIHQMSSYSCRKMNSRAENPWSEHAHGNAIDIGQFVLNSGKEIDVRKKSFFAFREKGLLKTVRADSCRYFTTVLGPGDPYHGNHFHFDLRSRKSGYRHCSL